MLLMRDNNLCLIYNKDISLIVYQLLNHLKPEQQERMKQELMVYLDNLFDDFYLLNLLEIMSLASKVEIKKNGVIGIISISKWIGLIDKLKKYLIFKDEKKEFDLSLLNCKDAENESLSIYQGNLIILILNRFELQTFLNKFNGGSL